MQHVLVTGGAGYIGGLLVRKLLDRGLHVRVVDRLLYGGDALTELTGRPGFKLIVGDVRDEPTMRSALDGIDSVAHLAAIVGDPACALYPELAMSTNLDATRMLADVCIQAGVTRLVFASTCSVYGSGGADFTEDSPVNLVSLYAETKASAEQAVLTRVEAGLRPVVLRFATIYGLAPRLRFDLVANLLMARAIRDGTITIHGGDQWRPFLHVSDAARAIELALMMPDECSGRIYNVGLSRENHRLRDLGALVVDLAPGTHLTLDASVRDRRSYHVQFDRFTDAAGFQPSRSLRDGLVELRDYLTARPEIDVADPRWDNAGCLASGSTIG